jgi:hypothetical protein
MLTNIQFVQAYYMTHSEINWYLEYSCESLRSMEEPCADKWSTPACGIWTGGLVDIRL